VYLCYIDESGVPDVPGNTSHFVLAGIAIPVDRWTDADREITALLAKYDLAKAEIHTAWLMRPYLEQSKIANFDKLSRRDRRAAVESFRAGELLRLQKAKQPKAYKQARKNYAHTKDYVHLTHAERVAMVREVADCVAKWDFAVLFAEAIDKLHFNAAKQGKSIGEQAFEQVVSRFQQFLVRKSETNSALFGLIVHDNNHTVAEKHTDMMRHFLEKGTLWAKIDRIIETPLFVDSRLTRMVQIADLCSFAIRRFCENGETILAEKVLLRSDYLPDRKTAVGVRHFSAINCTCAVCEIHQPVRVAKAKAQARAQA
jgi:hypothetical protein